MPLRRPIGGRDAQAIVDALATFLDVVAVNGEVEARAIQRRVDRNARSGAMYDALHLITAELAGADAMVTLNAKDFARLSQGGPAIVVPGVDPVPLPG